MTAVTTEEVGPPANVSGLLRLAATNFADRPALISAVATRSWGELDRAVDVGANALLKAGIQAGERVVVSLQTGPEILTALFAVVRAGMIAVPIGPDRSNLDDIVHKVTARAAVTGQADLPVDVTVSPAQVATWWTGDGAEPISAGGGEDIAVLARAASTQRPVMVSHRALLAAVSAIVAAPSLKLRADDRSILVLPSYHLAGWVTAFLPLCLVGAAAVVPQTPTDELPWIDAVLATISRQRVTVVPGAPSLYRRLRSAKGVERSLASVRLMTSGAAPLDPGDFSAIRALTGQAVWEGYGISESSSVVSTSLMTRAARTGSVGLALPGLTVRIVGDDEVDLYADPAQSGADDGSSPEAADPAADVGSAGEVGHIQVRGPTLFSGYWPDGSGGVDGQGWFTTGDLGYLDDIGELHLVDRAAETIRIAGFTVYPREIEDILTTHPYVRDAAVIGAPGRAGEAVVAVLVPLWGTHPTPGDLEEFVAARLPVFKRPQRYQLVDRLPRNEIGRVDRERVRVLYRNGRPPDAVDEDGPGSAEAAARVLADLPDPDPDPGTADAGPTGGPGSEPPSAEVAPAADVTPEPAASLDELGHRLPGTGERNRRGNDDTDEDLF